MTQNSRAIRSASGTRPPACRCCTDGRRLHVVAPRDTKWARRFAEVLSQIFSTSAVPIAYPRGSSNSPAAARRC